MFKRSTPAQIDIFKDVTNHISTRKAKMLNQPSGWQNVFYKNVFSKIDESVFSVLFEKGGRPNAPLRILLSMMILKEGNGWSDEQLFDSCRFNMRCMKALGLCNIDDDIPVESTYYEFRRRLSDYEQEHGIDLIKQSFQLVTKEQIESYNIKGEKIRLDSKLIQSNIAKSGRLELILEAVRVSVLNMDTNKLSDKMSDKDIFLLDSLKQKTTSNVIYPLVDTEKKELLTRLGFIIKQLLPHLPNNSTLERIYKDHYQEMPDNGKGGHGKERSTKIIVKQAKEVPSHSVQSVHDPEATYRSKGHGAGKQKVSGYHGNITETCSEQNDFNLITDVALTTANICEDAFLLPSIEQSQKVLMSSSKNKIEHVTTDGGYDSKANREAMAGDHMPHWNMANHKGVKLRYKLSFGQDGNLRAYCNKTKQNCTVSFSQRANKYVVTHQNNTKRYLTEQAIKEYMRLQNHYADQNQEDINIRPNVEATIHQVFHRLLKRNKIKYRGMYKCAMYCTSRAFWTNFKRILKNEQEINVFNVLNTFLTLLGYNKAQNQNRSTYILPNI